MTIMNEKRASVRDSEQLERSVIGIVREAVEVKDEQAVTRDTSFLGDLEMDSLSLVRIDTLFVDEGFGTLDAQALDAVMTVLDELRRGGRTVGVISHLEELRARIPTRLEVIAGRRGSRLAG